MWNTTPTERWNWTDLKKQIKKHGLRNSLLLAPMPTASTSQILGNNECFRTIHFQYIYRRTLSGEYVVVNKHLLNDLISLGLWTKEIREKIIASNGSIQHIMEIPSSIRELYKTAWELVKKYSSICLQIAVHTSARVKASISL
jgi:ribonucleoside-diphosphate reductase alpha chain